MIKEGYGFVQNYNFQTPSAGGSVDYGNLTIYLPPGAVRIITNIKVSYRGISAADIRDTGKHIAVLAVTEGRIEDANLLSELQGYFQNGEPGPRRFTALYSEAGVYEHDFVSPKVGNENFEPIVIAKNQRASIVLSSVSSVTAGYAALNHFKTLTVIGYSLDGDGAQFPYKLQ